MTEARRCRGDEGNVPARCDVQMSGSRRGAGGWAKRGGASVRNRVEQRHESRPLDLLAQKFRRALIRTPPVSRPSAEGHSGHRRNPANRPPGEAGRPASAHRAQPAVEGPRPASDLPDPARAAPIPASTRTAVDIVEQHPRGGWYGDRGTMLEVRLLGPVEVWAGGGRAPLGGIRPLAVLSALVVHLGEVLSTERLVDCVWDEQCARHRRRAGRHPCVRRTPRARQGRRGGGDPDPAAGLCRRPRPLPGRRPPLRGTARVGPGRGRAGAAPRRPPSCCPRRWGCGGARRPWRGSASRSPGSRRPGWRELRLVGQEESFALQLELGRADRDDRSPARARRRPPPPGTAARPADDRAVPHRPGLRRPAHLPGGPRGAARGAGHRPRAGTAGAAQGGADQRPGTARPGPAPPRVHRRRATRPAGHPGARSPARARSGPGAATPAPAGPRPPSPAGHSRLRRPS